MLLCDESKLQNNMECVCLVKELKDQPIMYVCLCERMCIHLEKVTKKL